MGYKAEGRLGLKTILPQVSPQLPLLDHEF